MSGTTGQKHREAPLEETEYRPIDWKKVFLSPKYIRMVPLKSQPYSDANMLNSMAHLGHSNRYCHGTPVTESR